MRNTLGESLRNLKWIKHQKSRISAVMLVLSLVVSLSVFWALRQPGLTLAGDADCRITEHTHDDICQGGETPCELTEHIHSIECYSDENADTENSLDWQQMFAAYPFTGDLRKDLVGVAKTQVGYRESTLNFQVGDDGVRRGYTRYGAWYGTPYRDWSGAFVSFCLHYAGADPDEFPGNTGAASMAELWKVLGKYASAGTYTPSPGDLVFFTNNTVGIVTEVQAGTIYVIRGDAEDAVRSDAISLTDASIAGWGKTEIPETSAAPPAATKTDLLDISDGPAFFIFEGGGQAPQARGYSLRARRVITDLLPYLEANKGNYFFTLLDYNNVELPKDENGNYIAQANTGYKLTISFTSPEGFLPGTYQYQIPNGLMVDGGEGTFILKDGTNVGTWTVTDTGLITLEFNEHMNSRTDITISAALGIHFPEQEEPIDFDGKIFVTVEPPPPQTYPTRMNKWGNQGGVAGSTGNDPTKIYWGIEIIGNKDSQIPGSILTDRALEGQWSKTHHYTESDIANGLTFGVSGNGGWHTWHIPGDDPHLVWTDSGWTYKMPKTVICDHCGELELGNDGWYYYIYYSSTPDYAGSAGTFGYENDATIDGAYGYAWANFTHGELTGEIVKTGAYSSDGAGGAFRWEIQATIPGRQEGKRADYHWYIMDIMRLLNEKGDVVKMMENDAHLAKVTATYNGVTIDVPNIRDATENDPFAWDNAWTANQDGINYGREFNIVSRCQCTPDTCHWNGGCGEYWYTLEDGTTAKKNFCQCWTETSNVVFTFVYETKDISVLEKYGGLGYQLQNGAELFFIPEGTTVAASVSQFDVEVPIPGLFRKELTHDFDGYTANYKVTINESKLVLTNGMPLTIHDVMTDTLAFISGSLVITTEDANGNVSTLQQDVDYTVLYDGTGNRTDANGKKVHILDIVILHPQPVMYILDYDATLIMPEQITGGIKYTNSASISLWGQDISDTTVEKVYADINIAAKNYKVEMFKTSAKTGKPLSGATFGLYNENGGLIATEVTDVNGQLHFQTDIVAGIILREHVLYYMQELRAPPGHQLDDTKHWFCFCDEAGASCKACDEILAAVSGFRIPFEQVGKISVTNEPTNYRLPATGGPGIYPVILVSVMFIVTPLVYGFIRGRKRERRGVG